MRSILLVLLVVPIPFIILIGPFSHTPYLEDFFRFFRLRPANLLLLFNVPEGARRLL